MMASMVMSGFAVNAEMRDAVPPQKDKVALISGENEILTAIDVVDLMQRGSSDAEIAKLLSDQSGYDRASALKNGSTDEQIIKSLIAIPAKKTVDDKESMKHKTEGDINFSKSHYDKAAKEYTLTIKYSEDKYEPYKLRADTYKQYLKTKLSPVSGSSSDKTRQDLYDKSKRLLCDSIYSDYSEAIRLNDKTVSDIVLELNVLKNKMSKKTIIYEEDSKVAASRYRGGQNIHNAHTLKKLHYSYVAAQKANKTIRKTIDEALSDYKMVCEVKEDAAHQELKKIETDSKKDKK
jgi:hypothetical protein